MTKPLLPTLRERNRYIAYRLESESTFKRDQVVKALWGNILAFLGELGVSETSLWIMDWDEGKQQGIIKVNHRGIPKVRAALALVKEIEKKKTAVRILGVSGTLKKARGI